MPGATEGFRSTAVTAGYHRNKRHWNTVLLDGSVADELLCDWMRDSYHLTVAELTRARRAALGSASSSGRDAL